MTDSRIAWILCSNRWNSAITEYALSTARALKLRGWTVFYSALADSPGESRARAYGVPGDSFTHFGLSEGWKLRRLSQRIKPDVIYLFGGPESFLSRLLPGIAKIRFRGHDKDVTEPLSVWKNRINMSHCVGILVPAKILQDRFAAVLDQPVETVYLGIDDKKFSFHVVSLLNANRPTLRILGRLDPIKGHQKFFEVYQELLKNWPKDRPKPFLEIIGQPANISESQLRDFAREQNLQEGQDWQLCTERMPDLGKRLSGTHVGVISSLGSEVICRVAEEFLLCGAPLFLSGVGSLEECLREKNFGHSFRGLDVKQTALLLEQALWQAFQEKEGTRRDRAQAARSFFSLESMGHSLEQALYLIKKADRSD